MKKIIIAFVTMLVLAGSYEAKSQINAGVSFNTFYTELSPYGRWMDYPDYGQVWISNENGFEPYSTNGHWEFTNYGWMWVSDYAWGWAPFHYGRWAYLNNYGWAWVPGYEWAPAWVGWCSYDGYYGWAPLSPGLGFSYTFSSIPVNYWRFVSPQYLNDPYVYRHYQRPVRNANQYNNVTVINNTVVNNNTTYVAGPAEQDIERVTKKKIEAKQVAFNDNGTKKTVVLNNKKEITVFRPEVKANAVPAQNNQQPVVKNPANENNVTQPVKPAVQQKQELIKQQDAVKKEADGDNTIQKQQAQAVQEKQLPVIKKQQAQQKQQELQQQEITRRQQQQAKEEEALKQQQNEARQQDVIRKQQQQNEARQQEMIRRQQRQDEIRQRKMQQPQMKQQEWKQENSFPKPSGERQQQPVRQNKKG